MREPAKYEAPGCAGVGGDFWFPERDNGTSNTIEMNMAVSICKRCPHQAECAEWGIINERYGIWGGITPTQMKDIRSARGIILGEEYVA
jgi:hypothetical protein